MPNPPGDHPCSHWYPGSRPFQAPEVNHIASFVETLPNLKAFVDLRSYGQMCTFPAVFSVILLFVGVFFWGGMCLVMGEWMLTYRMFDIVSSPFSFTCSRLPNDAENQLEAALGAVSALRKPYGTMFNVRLAIPSLHPDNSYIVYFYIAWIYRRETCVRCSIGTPSFYFLFLSNCRVETNVLTWICRAHGNIVDWMYKSARIKYSYAAHLRDTGTVSSRCLPSIICS